MEPLWSSRSPRHLGDAHMMGLHLNPQYKPVWKQRESPKTQFLWHPILRAGAWYQRGSAQTETPQVCELTLPQRKKAREQQLLPVKTKKRHQAKELAAVAQTVFYICVQINTGLGSLPRPAKAFISRETPGSG